MPRPGPRPYECMRRAWHSDRHQPLRGSVIRQIFRFFLFLSSFFSSMLYFFPRIRNRVSPVRLGSPTSFTLCLLRTTRSGRRSFPLLSSEPKKSSTPKPIPRFFSLFPQNACRLFLDLFLYFFLSFA